MKTKINIAIIILYVSAFYRIPDDYMVGYEKIASNVNLLIDITIIGLGLISLPRSSRSNFFFLLCFLCISTITFLLGETQLISHLNGVREFLVLFSLMIFFDAVVREDYLNYFNIHFKRFVHIFLVVQIPLTISQYLKYTAGDRVGGSFGVLGGSGELSLLLFLLIYYLIENKGAHILLIKKAIHLAKLFVFLIPIFLNETKISFILIPFMVFTFVRLKQILSSIAILAFAMIFLFFFASKYSNQGSTLENPITEIFQEGFLEEYLAGNVMVNEDVARFTKIQLGLALASKEKTMLFFGVEYGTFKGGKSIEPSAFAKQYAWLLNGSVPYFFYLLITGGLLLITLVIISVFNTLLSKNFDAEPNYSNGLLFFIGAIFVMMLFYNDAFRNQTFLFCFIYLIYYAKYYRPVVSEDL